MKTLVLMPGLTSLAYALYRDGSPIPVIAGQVRPYRGEEGPVLDRILDEAGKVPGERSGNGPDLVALRSPFGGELFPKPVVADAGALEKLRGLSGLAPIHLPPLTALAGVLLSARAGLPCVLVFESSFFVNLPVRERTYALGGTLAGGGLRRFGYHGLYHAAAVNAARRSLGAPAPRRNLRVLSFCLEPRPEMAAVAGGRPLMTTGGLTPLEGLPGHNSCGEIDPSIVLLLNERKKWGPEKINRVLTEESGVRGLTSAGVTFETVFTGCQHAAARRLVEYRFLLAAGAGMAAAGGVDVMVFSGRFAGLGRKLGRFLNRRIGRASAGAGGDRPVCIYQKSLGRIIADLAPLALKRR